MAPVPATVLLGPGWGRGTGLRTWSQGIYTGLQQLHPILKGSTFQRPKRLPSPHPGLCSPRGLSLKWAASRTAGDGPGDPPMCARQSGAHG